MPNIFDSLKFILDVIGDIGIQTFLFSAKKNIEVDHCVVNALPQTRIDLLSTNVINVNLYINKKDDQHDTATINTLYETIRTRLEGYTANTTRLGYYAIQILSEPFMGDLENTKFSIFNIRVTLTNNK